MQGANRFFAALRMTNNPQEKDLTPYDAGG